MKICIVGGGLAGLASAISLSKKISEVENNDLEIVLVEQRDFSSRGATFGLALNGQAALHEICPMLLQELLLIGVKLPTGGYMLPWYRVRDGLLEHARQAKNVTILINTTLVSAVDQANEGVLVMLKETGAGDAASTCSTTEMIVDLVVGADGVHSTVRSIIGAPPAISSHTKCWRGALNDLPPDLSHVLDIPVAKMIKTDSGWFSIFNFNTSLTGFVSWVATSKNLDATTPLMTLEGIDNEDDLRMARGLLDASTQQELEFSTILSIIPLVTETGWGGKGTITMIGDAAHALRPASGLGGSLALEDAALLTRSILKHVTTGEGLEKVMREFEAMRFLRCKTIVDDQTRIAEAGYGKESRTLKWTPEYESWLFTGPNADPNPPANVYVEQVEEALAEKKTKNASKGKALSGPSFLSLVAIIIAQLLVAVQAQEQENPLTFNGGSLLAMAGNECVALAVDKRFGSGRQMVTIAPRHVWTPHSNLMLGFVGLEGDVRSLSDDLKLQVASKRNRSLGFDNDTAERRISPPALASITSHMLYRRRGYFVEPIVAGLLEKTRKPFLCAMDMIGAQSFSKSFVCSGAASKSLYGTAEALWKPQLEPEELAEVCGKAFQSALERDCLSGYGILVYLITKDGIIEYDLASRND
jgi:20S proteasome subunit beta 3